MTRSKWILAAVSFSAVTAGVISLRSTPIVHEFKEKGFLTHSTLFQGERQFAADLDLLQSRVEEALVWRASAVRQIHHFTDKAKRGTPLSPDDLRYLHDGAKIYLSLRQDLLRLAHQHKNLADKNFVIALKPGEGTNIEGHNVRLDPTDKLGRLLIKQFKLSLASALILYDNFLVAIWPYYQEPTLRKRIDFDNKDFLNGLSEITANYLNSDYRSTVHLAASLLAYFYSEEKKWSDNSEPDYLDTLITGSPSFYEALKPEWTNTTGMKVAHSVGHYLDSLSIFRDESMNIVSLLFGNSVGLVETRKGKLYDRGEEFVNWVKSQLKPMDILLEKTPFRLTDKLIPGHYGHVAVWLGTRDEIKASTYWEDARLKPHHALITQGHSVLEALRSGVQLSTLNHFLNVDDLLVLRLRDQTPEALNDALSLAIDQIGKEYDFNFDVETDKRIVCSELAYVVFPRLPWPVEKAVGRYTISPDNVAALAVKMPKLFEIPLVIHDGLTIDERKSSALKNLLAGKSLVPAREISSEGK